MRRGPRCGRPADPGTLDLLVVGAGAAGLSAALAARDRGWRCVVLEKGRIADTIEDFPDGKWIYAEPDAMPALGKLWLEGARKEDLVARWHRIVSASGLEVRTDGPPVALARRGAALVATTPGGIWRAKKVVLATGQRGNPRELGVPGEHQPSVHHRLYSPGGHQGENILVVGGGNSAVEAALSLCERNRVVVSCRQAEFVRVFKDNAARLRRAVADGRIEVILRSRVSQFRSGEADLEVGGDGGRRQRVEPFDHAFVLIGSEVPAWFPKSLGVQLENAWQGQAMPASGGSPLVLVGLWMAGAALGGSPPTTAAGWSAGPVVGGLAALLGLGGLLGGAP